MVPGCTPPPDAISNDELVEAFNTWVDRENEKNAEAIAAGEKEPLARSSSEFIEKALGIHCRYVINCEGILDQNRMVPVITGRDNEDLSVQCEMSLHAARGALALALALALAQAQVDPAQVDMIIVACPICSGLIQPWPSKYNSILVLGAMGTILMWPAPPPPLVSRRQPMLFEVAVPAGC